jgi:hypothetical protein
MMKIGARTYRLEQEVTEKRAEITQREGKRWSPGCW